MSYVPKHIAGAAFDAHIGVVESLSKSLGCVPSHQGVSHVMAVVYGEALALYAASPAQPHQLETIDGIAKRSYETMLSTVMARDCVGSA